jgi:hypothetical protein
MNSTEDQYLTSETAAMFLTSRGFPISTKYFKVLATPSGGANPRPDRIFGNRKLWKASTLLRWAESRCASVETAS